MFDILLQKEIRHYGGLKIKVFRRAHNVSIGITKAHANILKFCHLDYKTMFAELATSH